MILLGTFTAIAGIAVMVIAVSSGMPLPRFTKEELLVAVLPPDVVAAVALEPGDSKLKDAAIKMFESSEDEEAPAPPLTSGQKVAFAAGLAISLVGIATLLIWGF